MTPMNKLSRKPKIIVIVGPTATGKTELAIKLAKKFRGEIVSADSRQVYRSMNIGTDKPFDPAQGKPKKIKSAIIIRGIPHHLIDVVEPDEEFTLEHWLELAQEAIEDIERRGRLPIVVGGTGLYISSLIYGFNLPHVAANPKLRKRLEDEIKKRGTEPLAKRILKKDPQAAVFLDTKNPRRLIRAWEVMNATKQKFSVLRQKTAEPKYDFLILGLSLPKDILRQKISRRLKNQFRRGLKIEVKFLVKKYGWNLPSLDTLGYSQWKQYIDKKIDKKIEGEIHAQILKDTLNYSKRQMTWFNRLTATKWLVSKNKKQLYQKAVIYTKDFLSNQNRQIS